MLQSYNALSQQRQLCPGRVSLKPVCWRAVLCRAVLYSRVQAQQSGDVGRVMMVLITDGRANVSLAKSNEDPEAMAPDAPKPSQDDLKVGLNGFLGFK